MARRSRIRRAGRMRKDRSKVEGLDHPNFASSFYNRLRGFANFGETQLAAQEKLLKRI